MKCSRTGAEDSWAVYNILGYCRERQCSCWGKRGQIYSCNCIVVCGIVQ